MTAKKTTKKVSKLELWLFHYLNEENPDTFLNKTGASKAAGYKAKSENCFHVIGYQNFRKYMPEIEKWMDEYGFSETRIKAKIAEGVGATETKFFAKDGVVIEEKECIAWETRRRYLEMMGKIKGMFEKDNQQRAIKINSCTVRFISADGEEINDD